jgi:glycerol uptake facilitator-like aquaporin
MPGLPRRLLAEFVGTAALLAAVVGSGIMALALADGNDAIALLANAGATAAMLYVLIVVLGPVSGAHFNPAVSLVMWLKRSLEPRDAAAYIVAQLAGAVAGVLLAHAMFAQDLVQPGTHVRAGTAQLLSEAVATGGLIVTIVVGARQRAAAVPALVACYIFAAYWFTASTSFANPAVTLARSLTRSFAGIRPEDVGGFVLAQLAGALLGMALASALLAGAPPRAADER